VAASVISRSPLLIPTTRRATRHHYSQEAYQEDTPAPYTPQHLTQAQFDTLHAAAHLIVHSSARHDLAARIDAALATTTQFDYRHGLDQLDALTRDRTSYSFAELPSDVQQAVLNLIASRDLTTSNFDLACWLDDLRHHAAAI
jgi:Gluconate 2-dehydrogenase subunit 3